MPQPVRRIELSTGDHQVRLVGPCVKFPRLSKPDGLVVHPSFDRLYRELKHQGRPLPIECFAIHAIDRADGQLKILEATRNLFLAFERWGTENQSDPSGKDGPHFMIHVDETGAATATATAMQRMPLSEAEEEMLLQGRWELAKLYSAVSEDEALLVVKGGRADSGLEQGLDPILASVP